MAAALIEPEVDRPVLRPRDDEDRDPTLREPGQGKGLMALEQGNVARAEGLEHDALDRGQVEPREARSDETGREPEVEDPRIELGPEPEPPLRGANPIVA